METKRTGIQSLGVCFGLVTTFLTLCNNPLLAAPSISILSCPDEVGRYEKLEITFDVTNTVAGNLQLPYDPAPPKGLNPNGYDQHRGISVDAEFTAPDGEKYIQPAFYYQPYDVGQKTDYNLVTHEWYYSRGSAVWKARFSPHLLGGWSVRLLARDAGGAGQSGSVSFIVNPSTKKGFLRVSQKDPRFFEFEDGTLFNTPAINFGQGGAVHDLVLRNKPHFIELQKNRIQLVRIWISSIYGAGWPQWLGGRNQYDGYLPRPGIVPFHDTVRNHDVMTLLVKYPEDWFDACRMEWWDNPEPVKRNTRYKMSITYWGQNIQGPRVLSRPEYGLVLKMAAERPYWEPTCHEPGTGMRITDYGGNTTDWMTLEGFWDSGSNDFLPRVLIGMENVSAGSAYVLSLSLREDLGNEQYGPELMMEPSMEYELHFPEYYARTLDKYLELAEQYVIYVKLVLMDKDDKVFMKLEDDGTFVTGSDNLDGFYGLGRALNKTRWLQEAWYRYLQARWGYSPNIHSWELTNEGDPWNSRHWEMTDELGKFMNCRAFRVDMGRTDGDECNYEHPNRHMVTTSFWHSFPGGVFWGNPAYPNVDYADVHAYISTSPASEADRILMEKDAAHYHIWHSQEYGDWNFNFPILRGEAGLTPRNGSTDDYQALGVQRDTQGVWYHNFVWSGLHSGALYEIYWYYEDHIINLGSYDHRPTGLSFANFLNGEPLNNGNYRDLEAEVSNINLRVVGQKDMVNGNALLWIQNRNHTWRNVVDGVSVSPASGTVRVPGFGPSQACILEWWNPYKTSEQITSQQRVATASDGSLTISIANLAKDMAVKAREARGLSTEAPAPPSNLRVVFGP